MEHIVYSHALLRDAAYEARANGDILQRNELVPSQFLVAHKVLPGFRPVIEEDLEEFDGRDIRQQ